MYVSRNHKSIELHCISVLSMSRFITVLFEHHIYGRDNPRLLKLCQSKSFFTANLAANKGFGYLYVLVILQGVWIIR
jgi:hypothetical protein